MTLGERLEFFTIKNNKTNSYNHETYDYGGNSLATLKTVHP